MLLVCSSRDPAESQSEELRLAFSDLERGETRRLPLAGFDAAELADLVSHAHHAFGAETQRVVDALRDETAGNPLYASQLIRYWVESGRPDTDLPQSLRDVVWIRVKALGTGAADVLATASVLGMEFREDVLGQVVDLAEPALVDVLDLAVRAGLLVDAGPVRRSMRFVHTLRGERVVLRARPGEARPHPRTGRGRPGGRRGGCAGRSGGAARCVIVRSPEWQPRPNAGRRAPGDDAFDHLAPTEAAYHYGVALDLAIALDRPDAERADLLVRLGSAQHRSGDAAALATLEEGALLARRSGADDALIKAVLAADRGFMRYEGAPEFLASIEAAVAVADRSDTETYARLLALLAQTLAYTRDDDRRFALAASRHSISPTAIPRSWRGSAPRCSTACGRRGSDELSSRIATRAITAAEASGDPRLEFSAHLSAYHVAIRSADHVAATRSLAKIRSGARSLGEPRLRWIAALVDTFDATMAGRLAEAEVRAGETLELGMQIAAPDAFALFAGQFFVLATFGGRHDELFPLVEQTAADNPTIVPFALAYGIICAAVGREKVAREILRDGMANDFSEIPVNVFWMTSVIGYAILATELDDAEAALQLFPLIEPFAGQVAYNGVTSQGPIAAYVGKLASVLGWHDVAEDHLAVALEIATAFGWIYHRATTLFALAQARHRRFGKLDPESRAWLTEAGELCRAGGFTTWTPRVEALERENARTVEVRAFSTVGEFATAGCGRSRSRFPAAAW